MLTSLSPEASCGAERVRGAPTDNEDGVAVVFDVVFDVMTDAAGVGHAGGADDDAGLRQIVDGFGFVDALDVVDVGRAERIAGVHHHVAEFLVETLEVVLEDLGCLQGQRTVHVDRQRRDAPALGDLVGRIEQLLGASDGK